MWDWGSEMKIIEIVIIIMMVIGIGAVGYFLGILSIQMNEKELVGLWTSNACDFKGEWVHVNIDGMKYEKCVEIVRHECAHELWAEVCEKNDELCIKGQELLDNYTGKWFKIGVKNENT